MKIKCPLFWKQKEKKNKGPKSVNIFLAFFFVVNYCLGTGFLGVPFSFFYAGYLAAIPTLLLVAFVSWNNAEWEIETMARAQAIDTRRRERKRESGNLPSESESEREILIPEGSQIGPDLHGRSLSHPRYEIRTTRKFEPIELCEIFLTRWGKYAYMIIWSLNCFLTGWSFTTVAASAWSTNIPFATSTVQQCTEDDFSRVLIPQNDQCWNAYMICVLLFAAIVVPLSLIDLSEQALLHMSMGLLRFVTIATIVVYCVVKLGIGTNECSFKVTQNSTSLFMNSSTSDSELFTLDNNSSFYSIEYGFSDLSRIVFRYNVKGWLISIPIFTFALMLHQGIPALTHPIREKHRLRQFMVAMFGIATISYLSQGVVVPLWFKADIQETSTLNWVPLLTSPNGGLRALSYYLILFPSIDVISAYPLTIYAISNNIFMIIRGRDTSRKSKHPTRDCILHYGIKFTAATLPIVAALFVSNLVYVLKYAGITGFFICFIFPTSLQLRSMWVCSDEFGDLKLTDTVKMKPVSKMSSTKEEKEEEEEEEVEKEEEEIEKEEEEEKQPVEEEEEKEVEEAEKKKDEKKKKERMRILTKISSMFTVVRERYSRILRTYQTPYSNRYLSHPVAVVIIGGLGFILSLLGVCSLAVHPESIYCEDQP